MPTYRSSPTFGSPVCRPIRTLTSTPSAPLVRGQLSLSVGRCGHGVSSRLERGEERIALRVDDAALVRRDCGAQETLVVGEHLVVAVVAELLQQRRRPLDVREEKGDCACRQVLHSAQFSSITSRGQSAPERS